MRTNMPPATRSFFLFAVSTVFIVLAYIGNFGSANALDLTNHLAIESKAVDIKATGSLTVKIKPKGAKKAGARWQVDGGTWFEANGMILGGLDEGEHNITFSSITGWSAPDAQKVTVNANELSEVTGTYVYISGDTGTVTLPGNLPLVMVRIPAGSFLMGRNANELGSFPNESPQHQVTLANDYWMGKYEITKAQWQAVMNTTPWSGKPNIINDQNSPAEFISWNDAQAYIVELNQLTGLVFRLPSEAEWEYACRAGSIDRFYWGDDTRGKIINTYAWWGGNADNAGQKYAHIVGLKAPNDWGLHDMSGNVWEWCEDWYHASYTGAPSDGSAWVSPVSSARVLRGGSWYYDGTFCRSAQRGTNAPDSTSNSPFGFRVTISDSITSDGETRITVPGAEIVHAGEVSEDEATVPRNALIGIVKDGTAYLHFTNNEDLNPSLSQLNSRYAVGNWLASQPNVKSLGDPFITATGIRVTKVTPTKFGLENRKQRWAAVVTDTPQFQRVFLGPRSGLDLNLLALLRDVQNDSFFEGGYREISVDTEGAESFGSIVRGITNPTVMAALAGPISDAISRDPDTFALVNATDFLTFSTGAMQQIVGLAGEECIDAAVADAVMGTFETHFVNVLTGDEELQGAMSQDLALELAQSTSLCVCESTGVGAVPCAVTGKVLDILSTFSWIVDDNLLGTFDTATSAVYAHIDGSSSLSITSPNGGESWARGNPYTITWSSQGNPGTNVKLELYKGVNLDSVISSQTTNDGNYNWTIPAGQTTGTDYKVKVTSTTDSSINDQSNANFSIVAAPTESSITVVSPNGGESWGREGTYEIQWTSVNVGTLVSVQLYKGTTLKDTIGDNTANDGSLMYTVPTSFSLGSDYKIRVYSPTDSQLQDYSDNTFSLVAAPSNALTMTSPNGGESWTRGSEYRITWSSIGSPGTNVKLELYKSAGLNRVITSQTANDGAYRWTIPAGQTTGTDYKVKITSTADTTFNDQSNANFSIVTIPASTLTMTSPNGGESWTRGNTYSITWSSQGSPGGSVKLELYKGGSFNSTIIASTTNDGSYSWTIPAGQTTGTDYKVKVTSTTDSSINDQSNTNFSILAAPASTLTVTSPNGGESWKRGTSHSITWSSQGSPGGSVKLELYKGGSFNSTIIASTTNDGSYRWTIPSSQATDTNYKIKITSTTDTSINDQSNGTFTIKISDTLADLTITEAAGLDLIQEGAQFSFNFSVSNLGGTDAGPFHIKLYISSDFDWNFGDDYFLGEMETDPIPAGQTVEYGYSSAGEGMPNLGSGVYPIWWAFDVDSRDEIAESNEGNNNILIEGTYVNGK